MFPSFDFRQWYQTNVTTLCQVEKLFLGDQSENELYFRGMGNYDFVCISTFYRYFINSRQLNWVEKDVGYNSMVLLPEIDNDEYKSLSFQILDEFYNNLRAMGSTELSLDTIAYLAQHYGLPTDLIDFSYDPKIALFFACCEMPEHDCSVYMFDIYHHVKRSMYAFGSGRNGWFHSPDGSPLSEKEVEQYVKKSCTEIDRDGDSTVTPIIAFENIKYGQRILNQKGAFIYHRDPIPMDQLMYTASTDTFYQGRRVYKISKELKPIILQILDDKYGINKSFAYPSYEADQNLEIIEMAVEKTKEKFGL